MAKLNVVAAEEMKHGETASDAVIRNQQDLLNTFLLFLLANASLIGLCLSPVLDHYYKAVKSLHPAHTFILVVILIVLAVWAITLWRKYKNISELVSTQDCRILLRSASDMGVWLQSDMTMLFTNYLISTGGARAVKVGGTVFKLCVKYCSADTVLEYRTFLLNIKRGGFHKQIDFVEVAKYLAANVDTEPPTNFRKMVIAKFPQIANIDVVTLVSGPSTTFDLGEIDLIPKANQIAEES